MLVLTRRVGASMGPRLFSRGRRHAETLYCGCVELQWGRGSSAAEGTRTLTGCSICRTLQWGRGSSAAEGVADPVRRLPGVRASMGPRLFSRGRSLGQREAKASTPLQWGRGSSAAEGRPASGACRFARRSFNGAAALQPRKASWERPPSGIPAGFNGAAALQPRKAAGESVAAGKDKSFNGAAALQPRKGVPLCRFSSIGWVLLQWGRGSSAAEGTYRVHLRVRSAASMGPRLFSRGRMVRRRTAVSSPSSFNGAAALQPRKAMLARLRPAAPTGFNGAAALQPRKDTTLDPRTGEPKGFNGAAALQPRKAGGGLRAAVWQPSFNGAAALQPRKG